MPDPEPDLQDVHDFLITLAHEAGEMILAANPSTSTSGFKKNTADLVTETDQAVEKMISTRLQTRYPTYSFLGEETYLPSSPLTAAPTFIVDPIDGTVNFVHGHPYVAVSLAFTVSFQPLVGVVYNPFTSSLYTAIRGRGAFLNRTTRLPLRPASSSPLPSLANALVAVEWGSDRSGANFATKCATFANLARVKFEDGKTGGMVHSLRSLGSAALNFCGVAAGQLDVYWEAGCWAWDVAAGWVILEEAGGIVADAHPGGWRPAVDGRRYIAVRACEGGEERQRGVVEEFWGLVEGRFEY
ncbi:MAG: hypothetical protein M1833_001229 [Piccolia ochrophora]|nr:MAG: hypothetical protein M1833_001229 [Piccolia ochrophora]